MVKTKTLEGVLAAVLALSACNGGSGSTPAAPAATPAPTPAPCTQTFLLQGSSPIPASTLVIAPITSTTTGRLDVILDWTFADSQMGVYVTQGACALADFNARNCNFIIRSESGAKPRRVSASNVSAGTYQFLVANFSTRDESASTQVISSSASCPALTSGGARMEGSGSHVSQVSRAIHLSDVSAPR